MLHNRKSLYGAAVALAMTVSLAACGGGGGGGGSLPSTGGGTTNNPTPTQMGQAKMTIQIPAKTSSAKSQYVSSATQSITISQNGTQIGEQDLTATSSGCAAGAGGSRTCTAIFSAPVGVNQVFTLTMWDQPGGKGNKLSTGNVIATIQAGAIANVPVTLDGVPASASIALGTGTLPVGHSGSTSVTVVAKDSSGNVIVGPGGYSNAFTLAISGDTYSTLSLSEKTISSPGQTVTLAYNGSSNVGSTITASATGISPVSASFSATGVSMALSQYLDTTNLTAFEPYDAAAAPVGSTLIAPGTGVIMGYYFSCCGGSGVTSTTSIAIASPTSGITKIFQGDVTDPYNTPAPGSVTVPGATVVHGMAKSLEDEDTEAYDTIAVGADGSIYYSPEYTSNSASSCAGTLATGGIGVLNPAAGTAVEHVLKGYPGPIKIDKNGNAWWTESAGYCNSTNLLGGDSYAIGEMTPSGQVTETKFSSAGLSNSVYPSDMALSPDGSQMYIADYYSGIFDLPTATLSSPTSVTLALSYYPASINTTSDGTVLWYSFNDPESEYAYGFIPGSKPFAQANVVEKAFPAPSLYSYTSTAADGSFWIAGCDYGNMGRISGASTGNPVASYFQMPNVDNDYQYWTGIGAGGGYVWAADYDYYNIAAIQYGLPGSGSITFNSHRVGAAMPAMMHFDAPRHATHFAAGGRHGHH